MTQKKIGSYICSGCEIGSCLDLAQLSDVIQSEYNPTLSKTNKALCQAEGIESIKNDILENKLEGIVIGACSQRFFQKEFSFDEDVLVERVNLREQVVWSQEANHEDTQMLAEDLMRMGHARINNILCPVPFVPENPSKIILVIGGGIAGITAAIEGAKAGYEIILLEKESKLGGWSNHLHRQIPLSPPYEKPEMPIIDEKIKELGKFPNIKVLLSSQIIKISGQPGDFNIELSKEEKTLTFRAGAIVTAMGWKPYDASKLTHLAYGQSPNILTNVEFEEMAKNGQILCPNSGKTPKNAVFVQCAGSRDKDHLSYCSNFCCNTTLKQARYILDQHPECNVFIIYKDMRTPGNYEHFYQHLQNEDRVFFTKGEILEIKLKENGSAQNSEISVEVFSELFNENIVLDADLLVLATGMTPANSEELNLNYRLGKGLPNLKYDFPDSHFICFPYETRRTGIYAAGAARMPMDIPSSMEDAGGAMLKAIQCAEATSRGEAVHPRSGDQSSPELFMQRCTDCKRCTEECPFGAYDETESGTPLPNPSRCRRCGICLGACPERIISFSNFSINSISEMIKAVHVPDEFEEKPRILAFVCENDAYPAFDMAAYKRLKYSPFIRIIPVRCIGSVNKIWISDALSQGFDGIMQIGCKPGDDYQCHFIQGSELTEKRGENIQETLDKMMLESERIRTVFLEITDFDKIPDIINDYVEEIELIGPNPFKDM
jgi:quinone-modifying oxidoreductase, subunit QmoB